MHPPQVLIRYGLMSHVGRFAAGPVGLVRGQSVVLRTGRGLELGEVLATLDAASTPAGPPGGEVLRPATRDDLERARKAVAARPLQLAQFESVFRDGLWPIVVLDVEPLLDAPPRSVLYYLGPHHLDLEGLGQVLRDRFRLDVHFEPAGHDPGETADAEPAGCGTGSCGAGGCGTKGGGCGTSGDACSSCGLKDLARRPRPPLAV